MKIISYQPFTVLLLVILSCFFIPKKIQAQDKSQNQGHTQDSTKLEDNEHKDETFFETLIDYVEFRNKADSNE